MRLLVDSDAFCKLTASELLTDALAILGADIGECGRLPALPHMLRRGGLRRMYGPAVSDRLILVADRMPIVGDPPVAWIDRLAPHPAVDAGEAILFATAAEAGLTVVTGDVRALRTLKDVPGFPEALARRVVTLEALYLALCRRMGSDVVSARVESIKATDVVLKVCFSAGNPAPEDGLRSYFQERERELAPLILWTPQGEVG